MFDCEPMAGDMERAEEPGGPPPEEGGGPPPGAEGEGAGRSGDCCGAGGVPEAPRTAPAGLRAPPLPPESSSAPLSSLAMRRRHTEELPPPKSSSTRRRAVSYMPRRPGSLHGGRLPRQQARSAAMLGGCLEAASS